MEKLRIFKFYTVAELAICSVWLLLLAHEEINSGLMCPMILLFPTLRIWATLLMRKKSKLMMAPLVMLSLMGLVMFLDRGPVIFSL